MSESLQWFKFHVGKWYGNADVDRLELDEQGAYLRLLCVQWMNGSIPDDDKSIRRILGGPRAFNRIWRALRPFFVQSAPGELANSFLARQHAAHEVVREAQRLGARKSWKLRAGGGGRAEDRPDGREAQIIDASAGVRASITMDVEFVSFCRQLVSRNGRAGAIGGDLLAPVLAELVARTAPAQDPPRAADEYAGEACAAFDAFRASCSPGRTPAWRADALRLHWDRIERIVAGADPMPKPWAAEPAKSVRASMRDVPDRSDIVPGDET